jgi:hypothetical protein
MIQLMESGETSSRPNDLLHDTPEAFDGVEMMAGTSRQQLQTEAPLVVG